METVVVVLMVLIAILLARLAGLGVIRGLGSNDPIDFSIKRSYHFNSVINKLAKLPKRDRRGVY